MCVSIFVPGAVDAGRGRGRNRSAGRGRGRLTDEIS